MTHAPALEFWFEYASTYFYIAAMPRRMWASLGCMRMAEFYFELSL